MRHFLTALVAATVISSAASAQDASVQSGPQNPAVNTTGQNNSSMPVAGANSFTMSQAKAKISAAGFTHVSGLKKDSNGVWRGTAMKGGQSGPVNVDYQGNVN